MMILLDECVPLPLARLLADHQCRTAQECGWAEVRNGELIRLAEAEFDLLITSDQNVKYQQNLELAGIAVLELSTNNLRRIEAAIVAIAEAVQGIEPGSFISLNIP